MANIFSSQLKKPVNPWETKAGYGQSSPVGGGNTTGSVKSTVSNIRTPQQSVSTQKATNPWTNPSTTWADQPAPTPIRSNNNGTITYSDGTTKADPNASKPTTSSVPTTMQDYLKKQLELYDKQNATYSDAEKKRLALIEAGQTETENNAKTLYDNTATDLRVGIPAAEAAFKTFADRKNADIAQFEKQGVTAKADATNTYGGVLRANMENKRQTDAQREKQYAALGTIDSYGTGSFTQGNENADTEFNRTQNTTQLTLANKVQEIDDKISSAKLDAARLIEDEDVKLQETIRKINELLRDNEGAKGAALRKAYLDAQTAKQDIADKFDSLRLAGEQQKLTFQKEQATANPQLSAGFMATGKPETMNDFIYRTQNPNAFDTKIGAATGKTSGAQSAIGLIDKLLSGDVGSISGYGKYNPLNALPGSDAQLLQNNYDQLKSMLSLEGRQMLKGSGQISDYEAKMLEKAASSLGQNLSPEQMRGVLEELKTNLNQGAGASPNGSQQIRVRNLKTGETGTIPENEFDPTLYQTIS